MKDLQKVSVIVMYDYKIKDSIYNTELRESE